MLKKERQRVMKTDNLTKNAERSAKAVMLCGNPKMKESLSSLEEAKAHYHEAMRGLEEKKEALREAREQYRLLNGLSPFAVACVVVARRMRPELGNRLPPSPAPAGTDPYGYADQIRTVLAGEGPGLAEIAEAIGNAAQQDRENEAKVQAASEALAQAESGLELAKIGLQRAMTDAAELVHLSTAPGSAARSFLKRRYSAKNAAKHSAQPAPTQATAPR
jgi:hypothetical protein